MRDTINALIFGIVALAIFDTVTFNGYYYKTAWGQLTKQVIAVTASVR